MKKPATLPRGYRTCTASLAVSDVPAALSFYAKAFGAVVRAQDTEESPHFASIKIGNSMLFVSQGWPANGHVPATHAHPVSIAHHMYVDDVDTIVASVVKAGGTIIAGTTDTYWGERCATVADPFGHVWTIATRIESLSSAEIEQRRLAQTGQNAILPADG